MILSLFRPAIFSLLIFLLMDPISAAIVTIGIFSALFFPRKIFLISSMLSMIALMVSPFLLQSLAFKDTTPHNLWEHFRTLAPVTISYFILVALLFCTRMPHKLFSVFLLVGFVGLLATSLFFPHSFFAALVCGWLWIFRTSLWSLALTQKHEEDLQKFSLFEKVMLIHPFWQFKSVLPVPLGLFFLSENSAENRSSLEESQNRGLRLLLWTIFWLAALKFFDHLVLQTPLSFGPDEANAYKTQYRGFISAFLKAHPDIWPPLQAMVGMVFVVVRMLLLFTVQFGLSVATARMMGFSLPKMVDRPYLALSFNNFFGRILHYYNLILIQFFFPLFKPLIPKKIAKDTRLWLSLFLSISMGGFIYHFIRDFQWAIWTGSLMEFFLFFLQSSPYYFVLGLVAATFSRNRKGGKSAGRGLTVLMSGGYLILYSCIYTLNLFLYHEAAGWTGLVGFWARFLP